MGLLEGKKALVFGVANDRSIAWGIAQSLHQHGAQLGFSYAGAALERRVRPLAEQVSASFVEECDVTSEEAVESLFERAGAHFGSIDILVHSIAFAPKEELTGKFVNTTREGFRIALDVSAYSLIALTRAALPLLSPGASILTLTYYGAEKVIPGYNVMGVAKAALEATVRYMAADIGPQGLRINAISAGPIRTLAASGVGGFRALHRQFQHVNPLRRPIEIEDVGNTAVWLCSELASGVTGEVVHVDAGYNVLGMTLPDQENEA